MLKGQYATGVAVTSSTFDQSIPFTSPHDSSDGAIGLRLKDAREARGLTQLAVSTRSKWVDPEGKGVSRTALVGYEAGTSRPGARELRILCETLSVTPNLLIFGAEEPFQASQVALEGAFASGPARGLTQALQFGLTVAALRGNERAALLSLVLSMGGRQLGDARLSGLRAVSGFIASEVEVQLCKLLGAAGVSYDLEKLRSMKVEDIMDELSREMTSNIGNKLIFNEEGDPVGGEWEYPDPNP